VAIPMALKAFLLALRSLLNNLLSLFFSLVFSMRWFCPVRIERFKRGGGLCWSGKSHPGLELLLNLDSQFASILKGPKRLEFNPVKNSRV